MRQAWYDIIVIGIYATFIGLSLWLIKRWTDKMVEKAFERVGKSEYNFPSDHP